MSASVHLIGSEQSRELHRGQARFADRFVSEHAGAMLHVHGLGWHSYDGARWAACDDGRELRAVEETVRTALAELPTMPANARRELFQDISKVESLSARKGVLGLAGALHPCTLAARRLDADPYLLSTRTGTLDLRTSSVRTSRPEDYISKTTGAPFDPDASDQVFETFLSRVLPDQETRAFIARVLGSSLLGLVRDQKLFIWHGTGANGKGTLRDAVVQAMGDYALEVPADILLASKYGTAHQAPERMRLKGARLAFCSEIPEGARMDEAIMKKLTGGDPVTGKLLYANPVEFDPSHTLVMLTNFLPVVRGDDPAVWRRILAVPFEVVVPSDERDSTLPERLRQASAAVFAWIWRGWLDYSAQGLAPPASVVEATRAYEHDSDVLARFLGDESAVVVGHGHTSSSALYARFKEWARAEGEPTELTGKAFTAAMEKRGHQRSRGRAGAVWRGISLAADECEPT